MPDVLVADKAGACYGVERALSIVHEQAASKDRVRTLGPLIHNPIVVRELARKGVEAVDSVDGARQGDTLVIRSHGVVPQVVEDAVAAGLDVVDATCPHVKKAHEAARQLSDQGYQVLVVGEAGHPEVEGILARAGGGAVVAGAPADLDDLELARRVGVVVQTTQSPERLAAVVGALAPRVRDLRVINTICAATTQRQSAAAALASRAGTMVVVGGRNSGNTRRLVEVCEASCANTHHVESASEIDPAWFDGLADVGVTAGASTPANQIDEVVARIREIVGFEAGAAR